MGPRTNLRDAAISYADKGWPVLPLVPRAKNPLISNGLLGASTDSDTVSRWWMRWPNANVGLRTGVVFDVLDIDGDAGQISYTEISPDTFLSEGPMSRTKSGFHILYNATGTQNRQGFAPGLDWRGTNGYIVAPPSIHPSGFTYYWMASPETRVIPDVPDWLQPMLIAYKEPVEYPVVSPNPHDPLNDILGAAWAIGLTPERRGSKYVVSCPFHEGDREPSMTLFPDQRFFCFGCGAWGNARDLRAKTPGGRRA